MYKWRSSQCLFLGGGEEATNGNVPFFVIEWPKNYTELYTNQALGGVLGFGTPRRQRPLGVVNQALLHLFNSRLWVLIEINNIHIVFVDSKENNLSSRNIFKMF